MARGARAAFHWAQTGPRGWLGRASVAGSKNRRIVLRRFGEGWDWSGEILPEDLAEVTLRVRNGRTRKVAFVRVRTSVVGSSLHLVSCVAPIVDFSDCFNSCEPAHDK